MKPAFFVMMILALSGLLGGGCEKEAVSIVEVPDPAYLVFGRYFGFCRGERCIEIYKIENGRLYEDTLDLYPHYFRETGYQGAFIELSAEEFAQVKDLPDALPLELFSEPDTTIGMPDAGDWGGIYVEAHDKEGKRRWWFIDNLDSNTPEYLHPFAAAIRQTVEGL